MVSLHTTCIVYSRPACWRWSPDWSKRAGRILGTDPTRPTGHLDGSCAGRSMSGHARCMKTSPVSDVDTGSLRICRPCLWNVNSKLAVADLLPASTTKCEGDAICESEWMFPLGIERQDDGCIVVGKMFPYSPGETKENNTQIQSEYHKPRWK
jgi:hypothetical protein